MESFCSSLLLETIESAEGGIKSEEKEFAFGKTTTVVLPDDNPFDKAAGTYITVETDCVQSLQDERFDGAVEEVASHIEKLVRGEHILIAALGNNDITPDSLGPKITRHLMVTRPFETIAPDELGRGKLRSVAAVCTNVFGSTGVESAEMIRGVAEQIKPDTVIVIDALSTTHLARLCTTVQIADTGLSPGSGVDNNRLEISEKTLGVPVISLGMPTVMDGRTLLEQAGARNTDCGDSLIAMPTGIGAATDNGAKLLAFALNRALHYGISNADILKFLS